MRTPAVIALLLTLQSTPLLAGTVTYVYTDPQGTTLAEADINGNIAAIFDYRPYGAVALGGAPDGPGYTGHVNDPDTALVYMQHRYYDPSLGRFLSTDPKAPTPGNAFDFNRFVYVDDNPIMNIDPDGTSCTKSVGNLYSCHVDVNKGKLTKSEIKTINKAYTNAVNRLNSHPGATVNVTVSGKTFQANAGDVARGLINATIVTSSTSTSARAQTYGGGLAATSDYRLNYTPETTIYRNALSTDRSGKAEHISTDLERTFVHEGIHMLPRERALLDVYNSNWARWETLHRDAYNEASNQLYDGSK